MKVKRLISTAVTHLSNNVRCRCLCTHTKHTYEQSQPCKLEEACAHSHTYVRHLMSARSGYRTKKHSPSRLRLSICLPAHMTTMDRHTPWTTMDHHIPWTTYSHSHRHHTRFGDETMASVQPGTYMIVADNNKN